jgi:hypothetical protein
MGKGTKELQKDKDRNTQFLKITYIKCWSNQQYIVEYGIQRIQGLRSFAIFNISCHLLKYALKCYNRNVTFQ